MIQTLHDFEKDKENFIKMISSVANLSVETQRKIASFVGAVVGDAACLHLEWVYDQNKVAKIVENNDPAFWKENHNPFFSLPNGNVTCYADEVISVHLQAGRKIVAPLPVMLG